MSHARLSADPRDRMGVYKTLEQVPDRYRLRNHANAYDGRDVWAEYVDNELTEDRHWKFWKTTDRIESRWKSHMGDCGRHHALATPEDVEQWCEWLLAEFSIRHAYDPHWCRVEEFYTYLQWHTDHPHVYNPFLMAAAEYPAAGEIWDEKTSSLRWVVDDE